jgi:hypothetical protein
MRGFLRRRDGMGSLSEEVIRQAELAALRQTNPYPSGT